MHDVAMQIPAFEDHREEALEDGPREASGFDLLPVFQELGLRVSLVLLEELLQAQLLVQILDVLLFLRANLALAVVLDQVLLGLGCAVFVEGVGEQPAALLVLDVGADLAQLLRVSKGIQEVVLCLEIDAHEHQSLPRRVVGCPIPHSDDQHREGNRQVERVEGRLVLDKQCPPLGCEFLELAIRTDGVQELAALGLEGRLQEEIHKPDKVGLLPKMALQGLVDKHLYHQEVVRR
mmetsp:Transcript_144674/g.463560  ORF Transcript_144674/g.463560 Transcript_144674/m.463560 type:complete len:235 (+) Transcript_144674:160-864(+)